MELTITEARNRFDKHCQVKRTTWEALLERLSEPRKTPETQDEYFRMSKDEQAAVKDVGGFIGGTTADGSRKKGKILDRTLLSFDLDFAPKDPAQAIRDAIGYAFALYSTHKHRPEAPRVRVVIPLSRPVSPEEYEPVARWIANEIGLDFMDPSTFEAARLMYWPSCSSDAEYIFDSQDGPTVNPDEVLAQYQDWSNSEEWPRVPGEDAPKGASGAKLQDPTTKGGIIGAFCRAYDVPAAIAAFLSDIYIPTERGDRYTYAAGSTHGGLVIYDDGLFCYSHHGTDPAQGQELNAFDLVRIHKYRELGEKGSREAMYIFAEQDPEVQKNLDRVTADDFDDDGDNESDEELRGPAPSLVAKLRELGAHRYDRSDIGNSALFSDVFGERLRYCPAWKDWAFYDGARWVKDSQGMKAQRRGKRLWKALMKYAPDSGLQGETLAKYMKSVAALGDYNKRDKMIRDARANNYLNAGDLDRDPLLFNLENGVLDLRSGIKFVDHRPDFLMSKLAPVSYDPEARCPRWEKFLDDVMIGDADKIRYLQKILGLALTGDTSAETMFILYGESTRNGKSTLVETIARLLGDYAVNMNPTTLAKRDRDGRAPTEDVARLAGARLVTCSEPPKDMLFDSARVKTMLGRDTITARYLNENSFEFVPQFKILMNTNHLPVIRDDTIFTSGRVNVVSFDRHFEEWEQDPRLKDRLADPGELSGILNWLLDGLRLYRRERLKAPEVVRLATDQYREASDKIGNFLRECFEEDPATNTPGKIAYDAYRNWCRECGYMTESKMTFFHDLRGRGLLVSSATVNGKTVRNVLQDLRLIDEADYI